MTQWAVIQAAIVSETDMLNGAYAEQILDDPILTSRDVSGIAWGDGIDAVPYVMVQHPTLLTWEVLWYGTASDQIQFFTAMAANGFSAIRLYNGLTVDSISSFDDIWTIDPQVARGQVDAARKEKLKQLIVRYKPIPTWCVLITDYV